MLSALLRILFGFIVACVVAGVVTVAFVVTPADIMSLSGEARAERLGSAGVLSLLAATHSAIFAFPFALIAIGIAEWQGLRSWVYYAIVGIAISLGGFGAEYLSEVGSQPTIVNDYAMRAFLTIGFFGGLAYWLVAGRSAGGRRADQAEARREAAEDDSEDASLVGNERVAEAAT